MSIIGSHVNFVAERFANLVHSQKDWLTVDTLEEADLQTLRGLLEAVNMLPRILQRGRILFDRVPVNTLCPYHVADGLGMPAILPSGWLNRMFREAIRYKDTPVICTQVMFRIIGNSTCFAPIVLNTRGDVLVAIDPMTTHDGAIESRPKDDSPIGSVVGIHDVCGGIIDSTPTSRTYKSYVCRCCKQMLALVPWNVVTYGDLRHIAPPLSAKQ